MNIMQSDYFQEAFGGFDSNMDLDAALKFCLNALAMDHRFPDLAELLGDGPEIGGIGGEPGWELERRRDGDTMSYEDWPPGAAFRAYVDPDDYRLEFPEHYYTAPTFSSFVLAILKPYVARHPDRLSDTERVASLLHG